MLSVFFSDLDELVGNEIASERLQTGVLAAEMHTSSAHPGFGVIITVMKIFFVVAILKSDARYFLNLL
jgi:hypothetical protein